MEWWIPILIILLMVAGLAYMGVFKKFMARSGAVEAPRWGGDKFYDHGE